MIGKGHKSLQVHTPWLLVDLMVLEAAVDLQLGLFHSDMAGIFMVDPSRRVET